MSTAQLLDLFSAVTFFKEYALHLFCLTFFPNDWDSHQQLIIANPRMHVLRHPRMHFLNLTPMPKFRGGGKKKVG